MICGSHASREILVTFAGSEICLPNSAAALDCVDVNISTRTESAAARTPVYCKVFRTLPTACCSSSNLCSETAERCNLYIHTDFWSKSWLKDKPKWKLKHANTIPESSEYFCRISSKLILIISSCTVSKFGFFRRSVVTGHWSTHPSYSIVTYWFVTRRPIAWCDALQYIFGDDIKGIADGLQNG